MPLCSVATILLRRFENKSMTPSSSRHTPRPGHPVRGSRTGRPVMALLDLLGRRWALRVLWELRDGGPLTFRELQSRSGDISSSVLNDRLRELREASIVDATRGAGYRLTTEGSDLLASLMPLDTWAQRWAERAGPAEAELTSTSATSTSAA
jgi:DNA-binding HxlR family transcriptional regulator